MKPLQLRAQMLPGTRRADGSVSLKLVTAEEIGTEQFAHIDSYRQTMGWLLFKPNQFNASDIPKTDAKIEGELSPSERNRRALYKLFMCEGGKSEDFPSYYQEQMNKIFRSICTKIENITGE
jgi:hypothetical protein